MFPLWNQYYIYMFLLENTFHICLLPVCQPASLPGNLEFRKTSKERQKIYTTKIKCVWHRFWKEYLHEEHKRNLDFGKFGNGENNPQVDKLN